jgi:hypothetical protein
VKFIALVEGFLTDLIQRDELFECTDAPVVEGLRAADHNGLDRGWTAFQVSNMIEERGGNVKPFH